jgi:hypothetical protein
VNAIANSPTAPLGQGPATGALYCRFGVVDPAVHDAPDADPDRVGVVLQPRRGPLKGCSRTLPQRRPNSCIAALALPANVDQESNRLAVTTRGYIGLMRLTLLI